MQAPLETRETLIRRLPDARDAEAWDEFVEIYEPLLFRLALAKGFQHADAEDFVQDIFANVNKAIGKWIERDDRGSFRAWLLRLAQNLAVNFLTRPKHRRWGSGDSDVERLLRETPASDGATTELYLLEHRRELFRWAADRVRASVSTTQWLAFWQTSVEGRPIAETANSLRMSVGNVYIARSRIAKRIRALIHTYEEKTGC